MHISSLYRVIGSGLRRAIWGLLVSSIALIVFGASWGFSEARSYGAERVWRPGPVLNQLDEPKCVGSAWVGWLTTEPYPNGSPPLSDTALYQRAQLLDIIPGTEYEGTTIEGGALALQELGYVRAFTVTKDVGEMARWVLERGPIVVSMPWYTSPHGTQIEPDGYHIPRGYIDGFHAFMCYGYREPHPSRDGFECQNSWGTAWGGYGGRFWLHERDMRYLAAFGLLDAALAEKVPQQALWDRLLGFGN
jgi:hypothetical protein